MITGKTVEFLVLVLFINMQNGVTSRIWTIALGVNLGAHDYRDDKGFWRGLGIDYLHEVCRSAGMECRMVISSKEDCWQSNMGGLSTPGRGLMARWFDGCLGWLPTIHRIQAMSFSRSYMRTLPAGFFVAKGNSFDFSDLAGKKIGFHASSFTDAACLARQDEIKKNVLNKDQVDAYFGFWLPPDIAQHLDFIHTGIYCSFGGPGLMARKDSAVMANWNVGAMKFHNNGEFEKLCQKAEKHYGHKGPIMCNI